MLLQNSMVGESLGDFTLLAEVGRGGMGVVYRARDCSLNRVVAVKVMSPELAQDRIFVQRFLNEARAMGRFNHPNIVKAFRVAEQDGSYYIATEFVEGRSLSKHIHRRGAFPVGRALDVARQVASALAEAHGKGIIHRDIKPQNIMLLESGQVKVLDFGLAKAVQAVTGLTTQGARIGTPLYMSPEQCRGEELGPASDIYSLGVTLFEMLAGKPPFEADNPLALVYQITEQPFPGICGANLAVPEQVGRVLSFMTSRSPANRYESAQVLERDLAAVIQGRPAPVADTRVPVKPMPETQGMALPASGFDLDGTQLPDDILDTPALPQEEKPPPSKRERLANAARRLAGPLVAAVLVLAALLGAWAVLRGTRWQPEPKSVTSDEKMNAFFTSLPDSGPMWATNNDTVLTITGTSPDGPRALIACRRGDTYSPDDVQIRLGTTFQRFRDALRLPDGRFAVIDHMSGQNGDERLLILPAEGGAPQLSVPVTPMCQYLAVAPEGFSGPNVKAGDIMLSEQHPAQILAFDPNTRQGRIFADHACFPDVGITDLAFAPNGYLYVNAGGHPSYPNVPRKIYRFSPDARYEILLQLDNTDYVRTPGNGFVADRQGRWLFFTHATTAESPYTGRGTVFRIPLDGGPMELVVDIGKATGALTVSPDGSRMFASWQADAGEGYIYEYLINRETGQATLATGEG